VAFEEELKQLQHRLAFVDLLSERQTKAGGGTLPLLLMKLRALKIKMYQEPGHQLPHVHIDYGRRNHVASYSISEPKRLAGTLDAKYDREVVGWIAACRDKLLELWRSLQSGTDASVLGRVPGVL
jgi:hypothetical protein